MEEHVRNKMLISTFFLVLALVVVSVFAIAIKTDREAPVQEQEDINDISNKIYEEYEKGSYSDEEVADEYVLENGIYYLPDHAIITFTSSTSNNKALKVLSDFADAYGYEEDEDYYEVILKKSYSYNDLIKYCDTLIKKYKNITGCKPITK